MDNDNSEFDRLEYPNAPGHRGVDTSIAAAVDLAPKVGRLQAMVDAAVVAAGAQGLTADECCEVFGLDRWTVQPRTSELKLRGLIRDSQQRRQNKTGKSAIVWSLLSMPLISRRQHDMAQVTETILDGDPERYEQRYSISLGSTAMKFVRRPVAIEPPEGTVCFVDNGPRFGRASKQTAGVFKDGKWHKVEFEPTHWTHWEDPERPDGG